MARSGAIVLCGGLGPTEDDLTRDAIAEATGRPLRRDAAAVEHLKTFFAERGRVPSEANYKQCEVPAGGLLLDNTCGTAPGVLVEHDGTLIFAVPGPPPEMREMMRLQVMPRLAERVLAEGGGILHTRVLRLADIGESDVATRLEELIQGQTDPTIALYASPGEVKCRLATKDTDEAAAQSRLETLAAAIRERLADHIYGEDDDTMEVAIGKLLRARGQTLTTAESCTGGIVASRITDVPGSSDYFLGSVVSYSNQLKTDLLSVPQALLDMYGAVSRECALAMASGARRLTRADYAIAVTGIAGPGGGTPEKPVGLVYIAISDAAGIDCEHYTWPGTRDQFKQRVSQLALNLLRKRIIASAPPPT